MMMMMKCDICIYMYKNIYVWWYVYVCTYLSPPDYFDIHHQDLTLPMPDWTTLRYYLTFCDNDMTFKSALSILICTQDLPFYDESPRKARKRPHSMASRRLMTMAPIFLRFEVALSIFDPLFIDFREYSVLKLQIQLIRYKDCSIFAFSTTLICGCKLSLICENVRTVRWLIWWLSSRYSYAIN